MRPHDGRAIPTFLRQALEEKPLTVFGDGSQTRSFCAVDDLVRGLILLAESGEHMPVNIGNPAEMSLLELAEAVVAATARPARSCSRPCRSTIRSAAAGHHAAGSLGWEPEITLDDGLRRTLASLGRIRACVDGVARRRRRRRPRGVSRATASASPSLRSASSTTMVLYGEPDPSSAAREHGRAARPRQPLVVWTRSASRRAGRGNPPTRTTPRTTGTPTTDRALLDRQRDGARVLDRRHAAVGERGEGLERRADERARLRLFAAAAQRRYSGTFVNADGVTLPRVNLWMAWNEPNNPVFLKPQYRRTGKTWTIQSGRDYAKICNAIVQGIKSVRKTSKSPAAPRARGEQQPELEPAVGLAGPLRSRDEGGRRDGLRRIRPPSAANGRPRRRRRRSRPRGEGGQPPTAVTLGNLDTLVTELNRLYAKRVRIWITEYGYQTNPRRDRRRDAVEAGGVPHAGGGLRAGIRRSISSSGSCSATRAGSRAGSRA